MLLIRTLNAESLCFGLRVGMKHVSSWTGQKLGTSINQLTLSNQVEERLSIAGAKRRRKTTESRALPLLLRSSTFALSSTSCTPFSKPGTLKLTHFSRRWGSKRVPWEVLHPRPMFAFSKYFFMPHILFFQGKFLVSTMFYNSLRYHQR